jgi:hypothetical protein
VSLRLVAMSLIVDQMGCCDDVFVRWGIEGERWKRTAISYSFVLFGRALLSPLCCVGGVRVCVLGLGVTVAMMCVRSTVLCLFLCLSEE